MKKVLLSALFRFWLPSPTDCVKTIEMLYIFSTPSNSPYLGGDDKFALNPILTMNRDYEVQL